MTASQHARPAGAGADTAVLTAQRFARMNPGRGDGLGRVSSEGLPPGPRWPAAIQTIALLRYRHRFHAWLQRTHGDAFTIRLLPGGRPLVMLTRPEDAREIFAGDPEVFHAGKANGILGPIMGEHSLLLQDSAQHKRARRLLMPAFNGQALRGYADLVARVAAEEVATWRDGEELRSLDRMNRLTLEVILRVVFGVTDEQRLAALRPRVNATVDISPMVLLGWGIPTLQRFGPWKATIENQVELDWLIYAEIRERREAPDLATRSDVLSRLILVGDGEDGGDAGDGRLDDTELRDQLVTLLLAGHETTATSLAWALHELGRHPDLLAEAIAAADAAAGEDDDAAVDGLAHLEAVLKESMRLHPVIPMVVRTLLKPARLGGWDLPAGATVGPSILIAHSKESNHADPERFDPARFLGRNPPTNTWIPFGGGVRRCIGAGFAQMEGAVVLREVLTRFDVEALGEDEPRVRNITSVPRRGARIRVRAR
ncbi:cytochrome P450 [Nocardioides sp. TRM66260-LWL]|uniref:cytochrome P450 n=1 Tax=Nocardioides sp. TRM66260-LWL TaxID=2874478 RepID=UPI001CC561A1|nr:cytochrome P450 [Nocardioides sp. TRM66260-LWL]MBZ5735379.1 cytochrome P450 [Nocardioides sp. TRM66260-LWL]